MRFIWRETFNFPRAHFARSPAAPGSDGVCGPSLSGAGIAFAGGPRCGPLAIPLRRARLASGRLRRRLSGSRMPEAAVLHLCCVPIIPQVRPGMSSAGGVEDGSGRRGGTRFMVGGGRPKADHVGFFENWIRVKPNTERERIRRRAEEVGSRTRDGSWLSHAVRHWRWSHAPETTLLRQLRRRNPILRVRQIRCLTTGPKPRRLSTGNWTPRRLRLTARAVRRASYADAGKTRNAALAELENAREALAEAVAAVRALEAPSDDSERRRMAATLLEQATEAQTADDEKLRTAEGSSAWSGLAVDYTGVPYPPDVCWQYAGTEDRAVPTPRLC